jgi:hypothetical protein
MRYDDIPKLATWKNDTSVLRQSASGSTLTKLDAEIDNYHNAFAAMTKRNLLADISYLVRDWEKIHYARVSTHPNVVGLKEVIARKIKELSPSAFKYRQAMCIAFNVGCNTPADQYFRFSDNDSGDMRGKCNEMMHAIRQAHASVQASGIDTDETLKIFMAPEFYFRGAHGAYSYDLVSQIIPAMRGLGTDNALFQHWLFVFGTAVAASSDEVTYCTICGANPLTVQFNRDPASRVDAKGIHKKTLGVCKNNPAHPLTVGTFGAEVQNVALIQKSADTHLVVKEYVSGIDYIGNKVDVTQGTKKKPTFNTLDAIAPAGSNMSRIASRFQDERMGGGIFTMDGITFGMEICLDHIQSTGPGGRLANYANSIQILLIPSYGMEIRSNLYCTNGGIIFNVDGRGSGSSEVVVKGHVGALSSNAAIPAPKTGGSIEVWGPFAIPRHV